MNHEFLSQCGIFDRDYYVASYGSDVLQGLEPFDHFLTKGFAEGLKPCEQLDPLAFRLRLRGLSKDELLRRFVESTRAKPEQISSLLRRSPSPPDKLQPDRPGRSDLSHLANAIGFAKERTTPFTVAGLKYELVSPCAEEFLNRLREDRPFSLGRLSHGDWDALYLVSHYSQQLAEQLGELVTDRELMVLAHRLCAELHNNYENFAEHFMVELEADLRARPQDPNFMTAISFKGYPTADENLFDGRPAVFPVDFQRLNIFARYFRPAEILYDATLFKRWLIAGALRELPSLARQRPVILMGASHLASLDRRWRLPWFRLIPIPSSHAYPLRRALLETCKACIDEAKIASERMSLGKPLFILQGSSFAYWFQTRLFKSDPDVFYWDFGQALHSWFYDIQAIPLRRWGRLYGPTIVRNGGMEGYYRKLGIPKPVTETLFRHKR
jgi:hypothetical protein